MTTEAKSGYETAGDSALKQARRRDALFLAVIFAALALPACGGGAESGVAMNDEPSKSTGPEGFSIDPGCTLSAPLELELGEGLDPAEFVPVLSGDAPILYHGPQGGTHLLLAARVTNPVVELPGLMVEFLAEREDCSGDPACDVWATVGEFTFELMPPDPRLTAMPDGSVIGGGFYIVVESWPDESVRRATTTVTDRCGRSASAELVVAAE